MTGRIHSVQTMGTVDGPGVRYVLFLQGCPLRCACCHNPDTWDCAGGTEKTAEEIFAQVLRCRPFFGANGGVTVSGGEALLQQKFVTELFTLCRAQGIHTCLDTSGCLITEATHALLAVTDLVLLDIKYTTEDDYKRYTGGSYAQTLRFLSLLEVQSIPTWLRQVCIQGKTDDAENLSRLAALARAHRCVQKTELLAFRKLCLEKYEAMQLLFPFGDIPETDSSTLAALQSKLNASLSP